MKTVALSLASLLGASITLSTILPGTSQNSPYPAIAIENFMGICLSNGRRSAPLLPASMMTNICRCSINYIQERVSFTDFKEMDPATTANRPLTPRQKQTQKIIDESVNTCIVRQIGG